MKMKRFLMGATGLGLALLALAAPASAIPIAAGSVFNITGGATFDATTVNFVNPAAVTPGTGSFAAFGTCASCATMLTPLTYVPFTPGQIYTATNAGLTTTFTISSQVSANYQSVGGVNTLVIHDLGSATLTGYETTDGEWVFTANSFGVLVGSFSATSLASGGGGGGGELPEPASLALLGFGLTALGVARRRRSKAA